MNNQLTPRDMTGLTIIAEQWGGPRDVIAQMLGVSLNRTYRITGKWRDEGMISRRRVRPVPGLSWVFPTKSAAEALLGRSVRYWVPTPKMAAHVTAAFQLRNALTGMDLERWISERTLRAEAPIPSAGQPSPHIHDGRYYTAAGDLWAVEVELTAKNIAEARMSVARAWQTADQAGCAGLTYYCRTEAVKTVIRTAAAGLDLSTGPKLTLVDLDEFLAAKKAESSSLAARPGLRVIAGGAADHDNTQVTNQNEGKAVGS